MADTTSEHAVRQLVATLREPSMILRLDGTSELVNAAFIVRTGLDRERFEGFGWLRALHQGEAASTHSFWTSRLSSGKPFELDVKLRAYDGQHHVHRVEALPLDLARWFVSFTPVQQRVVAEPPSHVGDESLRALMFDHIREAAFAWEIDPRPRILLWNRAAEQLYGFSFAEVTQRSPHAVLRTTFPVSEAHTTAALRRDRRWSGEIRHTTRSGELLVIDAQLELVDLADGRTVVVESARDVTARRRDEHAVIDAAARLRLALSAAKMATWEWDVATDRLHWSPEHFTMLGVDPSTFRGRLDDFKRLVHPDDAERLWRQVGDALDSLAEIELEFRVRRPDGVTRVVQNKALVERNMAGEAVRLVGTLADVTEARATEARLGESDARFRALANAMTHVAWSALPDGQPEWVNEQLVQLTGVPLDELRTRGWGAIVAAEDLARFHARWPDSPVRSGAREIEIRLRSADGRYRWHLARGVPQLGATGATERWFTTATDIDERRVLEDAVRQRAVEVETVLDAVPAAVWITHDRDAREVHANRVGAQVLRSDPSRNLSKTGNDIGAVAHFSVWQDDREIPAEDLPLQRAARGEVVRDFSEEIRFDDGSVVYIHGNAVPMRGSDGTSLGAVAAFVDVTTLRAAEQRLRELARRKDDFLAMLSHELRNPLAAIASAVQLIRDQGDTVTMRQREVLERQTAQLAKLVDDLLDVSRISRGKIHLDRRPCELARLVEKAVDSVRAEAERKRLRLDGSVRADLWVHVDEVRFTQVLANILGNAVRFTPDAGTIRLDAWRADGQVTLTVEDNGAGIAPALLPHVFEMFVQGGADGSDPGSGGLGLGLSISKRLVELHGGSLAIASEGRGTGTTVTLRVPLSSARPRTAATTLARVVTPRRILVVDDHVDAADLLGMLLSAAGHEVSVAYEAGQALTVAQEHRPEVAFLDLGLPDLDGVELGLRLRSLLPDVRLVALTGYVTEADRQRSAANGFGDHIAKPVSVQSLLDLLER